MLMAWINVTMVRYDKWLDSGFVLSVTPSEFAEGLERGYTQKNDVKNHLKPLARATGRSDGDAIY